MFTYFHCYMPETWQAQIDAGLIRENFGFRFSQSIDIPERLKFNKLAAKGGTLYNLAKESDRPFYIDRLQGGCYLEEYPYDPELVNSYREMLGQNFYGFQMHEWSTNFRSDLHKLAIGRCPEWTARAITETIKKEYPFPHVFLESMNAAEMEATGNPDNAPAFIEECKKLYARRQAQAGGDLLPCDSDFLPLPIELACGTKRLMVEIGAQTPDTRIQLAYARGMAKAAGIPFGSYYEPWGGKPFSACCFQRDEENEWNIHGTAEFPFHTEGEFGGSSRSLQQRLQLVSYMAGAAFYSEEWGMCNTFYDWKDFELTPYGKIKKEFIDFTLQYRDIGTPVTPAAVVLPRSMQMLQRSRLLDEPGSYLRFAVPDGFGDTLKRVTDALLALFVTSGEMRGSEFYTLLNYAVPDAIDIVSEDYFDPDKYELFADLTDTGRFAAAHPRKARDVYHLEEALRELLPVTLQGFAGCQLTQCDDGSYYLLLTNNGGVDRSVEKGELLLPEATEQLTLTVKGAKQLFALQGAPLHKEGESYYITLPAGGYFFGKIG